MIREYVIQNGPSRASEIKEFLLLSGLSEVAARKAISRAPSSLLKVRGFFPKNELFLCLKEDFNSDSYRRVLIDKLIVAGNAYGRALSGLRAKGGVIQSGRFDIISGSPTKNRTKKIRADILRRKLQENFLIKEFKNQHGEFVTFYDSNEDDINLVNFELEEFLSNVLIEWLKKMNMVSYGKVKSYFGGNAGDCAGYTWDIVAPSYLNSLPRWVGGKPKPGFVVVDIYMGKVLTLDDVKPILEKLSATRAQKSVGNILPIIIHDGMEPDCFKEIKSKGFIVAQTDVLWGKEIGELLRGIKSVLENATYSLEKKPEETLGIFKRLSKLEGGALNLRGALFEFMVGYLMSQEGYKVKLRKKLKVNEERVEVDILAERGNEVIFAECKGLLPGNNITESDIDYWVSKQIPIIRKWQNMCASVYSTYKGVPYFEFYFSGVFSENVRNYCEQIEKRTKKYSIKFIDQIQIEHRMKKNLSSSVREIYVEQFVEK